MIKCENIQLALIDSDNAGMSSEVARHLADCPACRHFANDLKALGQISLDCEPSAEIDLNVRRLARRQLAVGVAAQRQVWHFPGLRGAWYAAAAMLVLGLAVFALFMMNGQRTASGPSPVVSAGLGEKEYQWDDSELETELLVAAAEMEFLNGRIGTLNGEL